MKIRILLTPALVAGLAFSVSLADDAGQLRWPLLKGPYVGQEPPGLEPRLFAPGVISTDLQEAGSAFAADATVFLFNRFREANEPYAIFVTEIRDGVWTKPRPAPFNSDHADWDFTMAPDGRTVHFTSYRPTDGSGETSRAGNIWVTQLGPAGWAEPRQVSQQVNSDHHEAFPSVTRDGALYFFSDRPGGLGECDIYKATRDENAQLAGIENLGTPVNSEHGEYDPFIAVDESYIIFASSRPGGFSTMDLYIAFRETAGSWTEPTNLGKGINTGDASQFCPSVTPDGRFFFFTRSAGGKTNIYWVDGRIIDRFRPGGLQ